MTVRINWWLFETDPPDERDRCPGRPVIAHSGGIDELFFVLVPLIVFLVLQWLSRRKAKTAPDKGGEPGMERLERRRRLAGGLLPNTDDDRPEPTERRGGN